MICEFEDGEVKLFPPDMYPAKRQEYLDNSPNFDVYLPMSLPTRAPTDWFQRCIERSKKARISQTKGLPAYRPFVHPRMSGALSSRSPSSPRLRSSSALPPPTTVASSSRASTIQTDDASSSRAKRVRHPVLKIKLPPSCALVRAGITRKSKLRNNSAFGCPIPKEVEALRDYEVPSWVRAEIPAASTSQAQAMSTAVATPPRLPTPESNESVPTVMNGDSNHDDDLEDTNVTHQEPEVCVSPPVARFSTSSVPPAVAEGERNALTARQQSPELEYEDDIRDEEVDQLEPSDDENSMTRNASTPVPSQIPRAQTQETTPDDDYRHRYQHQDLVPIKLHFNYPPLDLSRGTQRHEDENVVSPGLPDPPTRLPVVVQPPGSRPGSRLETNNQPTPVDNIMRPTISPTESFSRWIHSSPPASPAPTNNNDHHPTQSCASNSSSHVPTIFSAEGVQLEDYLVKQELIRSLSPPLTRRMSITSDTPSLTRSSIAPSVVSQPTHSHESPLMKFLGGLDEPMYHVFGVMQRLGFTSDSRLNALARSREFWPQVAAEIQTVGTLAEWILVKEGLEARARRLEKAVAS
ncbi:hypothetical protein QCA50_002280 [Cerrena zonata]|uniref:Uncharacterized protein n=1 Tax=Cerrena zonata TaxID=2478898 RepID=A0AAW0GV15_9APHY